MKKNRFAAWILLMVFWVSIPGICAADAIPDQGANYAMAGKDMTLDTGGAHFTLKKGETMKITHAGKTWTLTAKADTAGYVVVKEATLEFTYDAALLQLAAPGLAGGLSTGTAVGGASALGAAGAGMGAGLSAGHGGSIPPTSP